MKTRTVKVQKYVFKDELGEFAFHDIPVLVPVESTLTRESFDQERDDYLISSKEVERMGEEAARRFLDEKYAKIVLNEAELSPREINGIRLFLGCSGTDLGKLIDLDRSSVSRILAGKQGIQRHTMLLIMEKLKNEIKSPGTTRAILEKLNGQEQEGGLIQDLHFSAVAVAEWMIRKILELEENISNLKLQKLLYYAQGIGLGRYGCKLFDDPIVAWDHGPVVEEVWGKYSPYRDNILPLDPKADVTAVQDSELAVKILEETIRSYGKYGAWVLRDKTHNERPWLETPPDQVISNQLMKDFFCGLFV